MPQLDQFISTLTSLGNSSTAWFCFGVVSWLALFIHLKKIKKDRVEIVELAIKEGGEMEFQGQNRKNILRPLSPHLPIYKPQLTSTFPIFHRISGAFLTTIVLFFYLLCLKIGLICFTYDNFYQFFFYSSKLILISLEITALALFYHMYNGVRHLLTDFSGFIFRRKRWKWLLKISPIPLRFKQKMFLMKSLLFFKPYAVEADIRLLAFYLHLPDRKGFVLFRIPFLHSILYSACCGITFITHSFLVWLLV